jgi:catechol 2,3-dioxygenase-like lactoylglutathione lyase family enzyme
VTDLAEVRHKEEDTMICSKYPAVATVPVTNLEKAKQFYGEKLGLETCERSPDRGELLYEAGRGSHILVYERPTPPKSDATAVAFLVDDLESTMKDLKEQGIRFEEYDLPHVKTHNGVAKTNGEKTAWFKDPDGNIIAVTESEMASRVMSGQCSATQTA